MHAHTSFVAKSRQHLAQQYSTVRTQRAVVVRAAACEGEVLRSVQVERVRQAVNLYRTESAGWAKVKFSVQRRAGLGDSWKIVGPAAELGRWAPDVAPRMSWNEGDVWTTVVALPPGEQEFKAALRAMDGTITWEAGPDRTVVVPPSGEVEVKLEVRMPWEVTAQQEEAVKRCNDVTVVAMEEVKEEVAAYVAA